MLTATPVAEYSSVVLPSEQAGSNASGVSAINSFLSGLAAFAAPVASIVQSVQTAKHTTTTNTGDGQKVATPVSTTPTFVQSTGISKNTLIIAGVGVVAVVALVLLVRSK